MLDKLADLIVIQSGSRTHLTWMDLEGFENVSLAPSEQPEAQKAVDDLLE